MSDNSCLRIGRVRLAIGFGMTDLADEIDGVDEAKLGF